MYVSTTCVVYWRLEIQENTQGVTSKVIKAQPLTQMVTTYKGELKKITLKYFINVEFKS